MRKATKFTKDPKNGKKPQKTAFFLDTLGVLSGSMLGAYLGLLTWLDVIVLSGMAAIVTGTPRRLLALATVLLFTVAFPPYSWPTWWFCLAPLLWMWRDQASNLSMLRIAIEGLAIGFAMCWFSTGFVSATFSTWGWLVHTVACLVFSFQVVVVAVAIWWTRNQPVFLSAPICALAAMGSDLLEAWLGVCWSVTSLALTVGATPIAQWSQWITVFGVSGLLYLVNFSLVRERVGRNERSAAPAMRNHRAECRNGATACSSLPSLVRKNALSFGRQWRGPAIGVGIAVLAWVGGRFIADSVSVEPLSFSAMLVQPHLKGSSNQPWRPWLDLDRMTRTSLLRDGTVDLVVWPESSLSDSWNPGEPSNASNIATRLTVQDFLHVLTPVYQTNCLLGVKILERATVQRYGLEVAEVRRTNCGSLVSDSREISYHEKLELVPLSEGLPGLLDNRWVRRRVLPALGLKPPLTPGRKFVLLSFRDQQDKKRSIAVSICYESFLPWLLQYRDSANADAIVHLVYDGSTVAYPSVIQRQILACQYRAIETRKWNLVCSTWTGSAIIDPSGKIVSQLPAIAGTLRSDTIDRKGN